MRLLLVSTATLLLLLCQKNVTTAFPAYMLSKVGCDLELDTDEVIMNHLVVPATESDDQTMQLVVVNNNNDNNIIINDGNIVVDELPITLNFRMESSSTTTDFQYVAEINENNNNNSENAFINGACDGNRRIAGRSTDTISAVIHTTPATIIAGWATNHEAVRLVPNIIITKRQQEDTTTTPVQNIDTNSNNKNRHPVHSDDEFQHNGDSADTSNNDSSNKNNKSDSKKRNRRASMRRSHPHEQGRKNLLDPQIEHDERLAHQHDVQRQIDAYRKSRRRPELLVENNDNNAFLPEWNEELHLRSYYWGLAIFVGAMIVTIQACSRYSRRQRKGRREL